MAEVRRLIRETLAELKPHEHEVIELSIRHNLSEEELAAVLEVSWSRAHGLAAQAREHLEKTLDGLLIARTGRESCPELAALLADWDGRLTGQIGRVIARHLEHCQTCASRRHGALRPEVLSRLLPLAELPPGLREPILGQADDSTAATSRGRPTAPPRPAGLRRTLELLSWSRIRANPGGATAVAAVTVWIVAAMSATMVTLTGVHAARALAAPGHTAPASPTISAASSTAPASPRSSRSLRPDVRHTRALLPTFAPVPSASPPASAKPTASKSASPSPSGSSSSSASASASPTPTPTHSHTPTPTPTPT